MVTNNINDLINSKEKKVYAIMLFDTKWNLGTSDKPNQWVNIDNVYTDNGLEAITLYSNIKNPASQLIEGNDIYEIQCKMGEMSMNFQNEEWLNKCLYPFL